MLINLHIYLCGVYGRPITSSSFWKIDEIRNIAEKFSYSLRSNYLYIYQVKSCIHHSKYVRR
jgi:hypothetical protein